MLWKKDGILSAVGRFLDAKDVRHGRTLRGKYIHSQNTSPTSNDNCSNHYLTQRKEHHYFLLLVPEDIAMAYPNPHFPFRWFGREAMLDPYLDTKYLVFHGSSESALKKR